MQPDNPSSFSNYTLLRLLNTAVAVRCVPPANSRCPDLKLLQPGAVGNFSPAKFGPPNCGGLFRPHPTGKLFAPASPKHKAARPQLETPATLLATSNPHDTGEGWEAEMSAIWNSSEPNGGDSVHDAASMNAQYSGGDIAYVLFSAIDVWIMIPGIGFVSPRV
jgi:hypothetical protein